METKILIKILMVTYFINKIEETMEQRYLIYMISNLRASSTIFFTLDYKENQEKTFILENAENFK